jgi:hypothetical protein
MVSDCVPLDSDIAQVKSALSKSPTPTSPTYGPLTLSFLGAMVLVLLLYF